MPIVSLLKGKAKEIWATIISFTTLMVGIQVFREVWNRGTIVYALGSETPFERLTSQ